MAQAQTATADWQDWPLERKRALRSRLRERLHAPWELAARPEQLPPSGDWYLWALIGGRGSGKTRSGAEWLADELRADGQGDVSGVLAPTFGDARDTCIEGPSGLLSALGTTRAEVEAGRSWTVERWNRSMGELWLRSGAMVRIDGADDGALRVQGHNLRRAWCDEVGLWKRAEQAWDESLLPAVRLGRPQIVVTTTPKPTRLVRRLLEDDSVRLSRMSTYDNAANLADAFLDQMRARYEGTRLGRQELEGEFLEDAEGALWTRELIEQGRVEQAPHGGWQQAPVVGLDPSDGTEDGAEHGLACVALGMDHQLYVTHSEGYRCTPPAFVKRAVVLAQEVGGRLVVERNHGSQWLVEVIERVMIDMGVRIPYETVTASQGKTTRAQPVAALYEQGKVHHLGEFTQLEDCMVSWTGRTAEPGLDRLDALVWAAWKYTGYHFGPAPEAKVHRWTDKPTAGVHRWK